MIDTILSAAIEEYVEDEEMHEITEIVETYRITEDGKTWKTIKKTTTITANGTNEKVEVLKGINYHTVLINNMYSNVAWMFQSILISSFIFLS